MPHNYFSPQIYQSAAPFSHYVRHGNTGYTAGIIGQRPDTGELISDDFSQQCDAMLSNLQILLQEQGLTLRDLVRTTVYLTDYRDFAAINEVYARHLPEPYPARTTVQVAALPLGAKVQIESVVAVPEQFQSVPSAGGLKLSVSVNRPRIRFTSRTHELGQMLTIKTSAPSAEFTVR